MKKILSLIVFTFIILSLTSCGIVSLFKTDAAYTRCDRDGKPQDDGEYVLFGEYPQTIKTADVEITETVDERGYYLGSDGAYYAKVNAAPYKDEYTFTNGASVTSGEVYYFKVEPIRWRILSEANGEALLLCDSIIENKAYDSEKNNDYESSDVKAWLNGAFYEAAFAEEQRDIIMGGAEKGSGGEKLFLLSKEDAMNTAFGFNASTAEYDAARRLQTTDYVRANGAWMKTVTENYGNGSFWLRSPIEGATNKAWRIDSAGAADEGYVNHSHYGVVPALFIKLK